MNLVANVTMGFIIVIFTLNLVFLVEAAIFADDDIITPFEVLAIFCIVSMICAILFFAFVI